jgi:predicted nucleic acid-binding protein
LTAKSVIIDTGVLTLFFSGEAVVKDHFADFERGRTQGYVTSVNLSEFYYKTCQKAGKEVAKLWYHQCRELLQTLETDSQLCLLAGSEKCHRGDKLSLADCFALAAARIFHGTLLTTDPELAKIKDVDVKYFEV